MGRTWRGLLTVLVLTALLAPTVNAGAAEAGTAVTYSDVPSTHFADAAVRYTAEERPWLRLSGTEFKPARAITRRLLARAVVRAFAPSVQPDPALTFTDLRSDDYWARFANVAVKLGYMTRRSDGSFRPDGKVSKRVLARALVRALGLKSAASSLRRLGTADGYRFKLPASFEYLVLANELNLNYNYPTRDESPELYPWDAVTRADAAYALWRAVKAAGSWKVASAGKYVNIQLPAMTASRRKAVEFALQYVGYPYVYGGEWYRSVSSGYCCGAQVHGGFDCSGFVWWVMKEPSQGWNPTVVRPYRGWPLAQRASYQMAEATPTRRSLARSVPLDILFFDTDGSGSDWRAVDHAGLYLGNGWMIHSSGSRGGVVISFVGDGWWSDAFVWSRRLFSHTA